LLLACGEAEYHGGVHCGIKLFTLWWPGERERERERNRETETERETEREKGQGPNVHLKGMSPVN
jgi:hypothetical protein